MSRPKDCNRQRRCWLYLLLICIFNLSFKAIPSEASDFFGGFNFRSSGFPGSSGAPGSVDTEYYDTLGIDKGATAAQIKRAYRQKAMQCHPDKGGDPEEFKKITEAYEVLSNEDKKSQYDRFGKSDFSSEGAGVSAEDFFEEMFRSAGFGGAAFGGFNMGSQPLVYQINLRLEDFFNGKELEVAVKGGKKMKITIEKGMLPGQELLVRDYVQDQFGNPRDLVFQLKQVDHSVFTRKNADLLMSMKISLQDALMGFTLPIKSLDGKDLWVKCKQGDIKEVEDVLIIAGHGMPVYKQPNVKGRLFIKTEIVLPSNFEKGLDEKEIAMLNKLLGKLDKRNNSHKKPKSNDVIIKAQKAGGSTLPFGAFGGDDKRRGGRSYDRQGRATRGRMDDGDFNFMFQGANPFEQFFR